MLKKIIIISLLISVYISNITTIVYSANKNEKIALASNLQYEKVLENLSNKNIEDTQLIRKSFPQQYEKFISEYYQKNYRIIFNKNWNELSEKGKKLFLGIGIKSNLKQKLQNLNPETLNYLLEFINNYGDNEVIQKSFENVINLIPETEDKSNLNFLQKLLHTNHSLVFLKILEKLMLNFGVIKSENKQKITDKLYEGSSDIVKKAVDKFLGVLLMFNEEELAQKIVNIIKVKSKLSLSEQFLIALQKGHTNTVKVFLKNGFNANYTDDHGFTALMIAAKHGHLEMVEFFLKNGFDITAKTDIEGYTALLIAVRKGYSKIVRLLLQNHANINDRTRDGCNALMLAVKSGDLETVKVILENWGSRDVNIKTYAREEQDDPAQLDLDSLMLNDKTEALNLLLKNDAYIDGRMRNPRAFLVRNGVNLSDSDVIQPEFNALMFAAQSGHTYIVKLLLEKGADNIGTALEFASKNGHIETVRLLLNKADIDAKNKSLLVASQNGHTQIVELLLQSGADIYFKNNDGYSALFFASMYGHISTVQFILTKLIKKDDRIIKNNALLLASQFGCTEIAELLIKNGANIEAKDNDENTPIILASEENYWETIKFLLRYGANIDKLETIKKIEFIKPETIKLLQEEQQNRLVLSDIWSDAPIEKEKYPVIMQKLKKVLYINYQEKVNSDTALHRAIQIGDLVLVLAILDNPNLDVNLENNTGHTAMSELLMSGLDKKDIVQIANRLLLLGATIKENTLVKNADLFKNRGDISQVEIWEPSAEKTELLKLLRLQLLKEGKLEEYLKESVLEMTEIITFLIKHDVIAEITETLIQKLDLFMNKNDGIMAIGMDVNKLRQMRTMGV